MTLAEIAPTTEPSVEAEFAQFTKRVVEPDTVLLHTRCVTPDLVEVAVGDEVMGFLELTGGVWVALRGPVYSWATEVGQHLDPDEAVLSLFGAGTRPVAPTGLPRGAGPRFYRENRENRVNHLAGAGRERAERGPLCP